MWPALSPGDRVFARAARAAELRPGDIVIRREADTWIAHRLIGRVRLCGVTHIVTKGDNSLAADQAWQETLLVGVIIAVERAGRNKCDTFARARWRGSVIALLSRGQLFADRIRWTIFRHMAVKSLRACLRVTVWTAR
jgi:hypothetical protein